jgi:predicted nucleic acid-binding protein
VIFVDTSAWYAAYVASDPDHARITSIVDDAPSRLVTSDLVLAESLNLLRARNEFERAVLLGQSLLTHAIADLVQLTASDLQRAFITFSTYRDKQWSFVDCASLALMQRLGIRECLTLDQHFREMTGVTVNP